MSQITWAICRCGPAACYV